jgi:D-threonate/D-erythronate kinase
MNAMRLLADDLTGALDTAAAFVRLSGPISVYWPDVIPTELPQSAALDTATRELGRPEAIAVLERLIPTLASGALAFKKVDTLLRGHPAAELAACFRQGTWPFCVLAPAFPYQGRTTRGGRQYISKPDGGWSLAGGDLAAELAAEGLAVQLARPGCDIAPGITLFDAALIKILLVSLPPGSELMARSFAMISGPIPAGSPRLSSRCFSSVMSE